VIGKPYLVTNIVQAGHLALGRELLRSGNPGPNMVREGTNPQKKQTVQITAIHIYNKI